MLFHHAKYFQFCSISLLHTVIFVQRSIFLFIFILEYWGFFILLLFNKTLQVFLGLQRCFSTLFSPKKEHWLSWKSERAQKKFQDFETRIARFKPWYIQIKFFTKKIEYCNKTFFKKPIQLRNNKMKAKVFFQVSYNIICIFSYVR